MASNWATSLVEATRALAAVGLTTYAPGWLYICLAEVYAGRLYGDASMEPAVRARPVGVVDEAGRIVRGGGGGHLQTGRAAR